MHAFSLAVAFRFIDLVFGTATFQYIFQRINIHESSFLLTCIRFLFFRQFCTLAKEEKKGFPIYRIHLLYVDFARSPRNSYVIFTCCCIWGLQYAATLLLLLLFYCTYWFSFFRLIETSESSQKMKPFFSVPFLYH